METIRHKRGATLRLRRTSDFSLDGVTITGFVRGRGVETAFDVTIVPPAELGDFEVVIDAAETENWPIAVLYADFQFEHPNGEISQTETMHIVVVEEVT